jgi:hypothetical protein
VNKRGTTHTALSPQLPSGWITSSRLGDVLVWPVASALAYIGGTSVVDSPQRAKILLLLPLLS